MQALWVYCPAKILDALPSMRVQQPPTIIALPLEYGSLLMHKVADPTTRGQISARHGQVKRNLSYEEFNRQQALYRSMRRSLAKQHCAASTDTSGRITRC
jgi:hypothetical protein